MLFRSEDPFSLLAWRGRRRAELLRRIETLRDAQAWEQSEAEAAPDELPLAETVDRFWDCAQPLPELPKGRQDARPGAILDRLGPLGIGLTGEGPRRGMAAASAAGRQLTLTSAEDDELVSGESDESVSIAARPEADLTDLLRPAYAALARR